MNIFAFLAGIIGISLLINNIKNQNKQQIVYRNGLILVVVGIALIFITLHAGVTNKETSDISLFVGLGVAVVGAVWAISNLNKPEEKK